MDTMCLSRALGSAKTVAKYKNMMIQLVQSSILCRVNTGKLFSVLYPDRGKLHGSLHCVCQALWRVSEGMQSVLAALFVNAKGM